MDGDTHFVEYDRVKSGRKSLSICGEFVAARDISNTPTCVDCRAELAMTAEDMFGTVPPGTPVPSRWGNPLSGYKPRGANR